MTSFKNKAAIIIDKFNGEDFNLLKVTIEMLLAFMNLWDIMDGFEETLPSNVHPKVLKEY